MVKNLNQKYQKLLKAINSFEKAVRFLDLFIKSGKSYNPNMSYQEEYQQHRDSVVQRFEYSIDLFWKYFRNYIEEKSMLSGLKTPGEVLRKGFSESILSEEETEKILEMIKSRNMTSHIYVEEIAELLVKKVPEYSKTIRTISDRISP